MKNSLLRNIIRCIWDKIWGILDKSSNGEEIWGKYMFIWKKYNFDFYDGDSPLNSCLLKLNNSKLNKLLVELKIEAQLLMSDLKQETIKQRK